MKKNWLVVAIIAGIVSCFIIVKAIHYYSGGQLAQQVEEMRAEKETSGEKYQVRAGAKKATAKRAVTRRARQKKQAKPIDLDQFYRNIDLTSLQKAYAEKVVAALEEEQRPLQQELSVLRKKTEQALWDCLTEAKKASISLPDLRKMALDKVYDEKILPNINQQKRKQAEAIYQEFLTKRSEIKKSMRQAKQLATKMLLALLTKEQREIYRREHPPKTTAAQKTK